MTSRTTCAVLQATEVYMISLFEDTYPAAIFPERATSWTKTVRSPGATLVQHSKHTTLSIKKHEIT